jgi:HlyD family secretion protein
MSVTVPQAVPRRRWLWLAAGVALALAAAGALAWWFYLRPAPLPEGIVSGNGRIEAEQIDVATKMAGRVIEVLTAEGQTVAAGAVVARLDAASAEAQLQAALAQVREAEQAGQEAQAQTLRARSALHLARQELIRTTTLNHGGYATGELLDQRRTAVEVVDATIAAAEATERRAQAAVETAQAHVAQVRTVLDDTVLTAPRAGRVLYQLTHIGEVLGAGGRIVTLLDPTDVSMIVFLPSSHAGRIAYGTEARLVLDAFPDYVIPASVSFVSPNAQFTPRQVETTQERQNLMFRVKLRIPPELLAAHSAQVQGGVRGIGYVRLDAAVAWPAQLAVRLP